MVSNKDQQHVAGFEIVLKRKANVDLIAARPPTYSRWDNYLLPSLQAAYDFSDKKSRIRAVLLCNPNNPLSRCYPRETLLELIEFCQERGLHLICDEVSALISLNGGDKKAPSFVSALSLTEPFVPEGAVKVDPSRVHVVWSASKLFGMSGFKVVSLLQGSLSKLYISGPNRYPGLHHIPTKPFTPQGHGSNIHPPFIHLHTLPKFPPHVVSTPHSTGSEFRTSHALLQHPRFLSPAAQHRFRDAHAWSFSVC